MGSGLIDWGKVSKPAPGSNLHSLLDYQRRGKTLNPAAVCQLISAYLPDFSRKARASAAEVLGNAARDGRDACGQSFES